jgi:pantothenate kinase
MDQNQFEALHRAPLYLDQTDKPLEFNRDEVERFYEPLAQRVLASRSSGRREIVAVAGPPGSGKSAFAATLVAVLNVLDPACPAVPVGLDGWHYPNAYLDTHSIVRDGQSVRLRNIKGAPETYDHRQIAAFLSDVRQAQRVVFPVYSRELHDPVPGAGVIEPGQQVVVLEGNYWLLDEPPWAEYRHLFDLTVFLTAEPGALIDGLRERHLRGKKDPESVEQHMRRVDVPNVQRVLDNSIQADVVIHKADSRWIKSMACEI